MIARLKGILTDIEQDRIILEVNGIGYGVYLSEFDKAQLTRIGDFVSLEIYTHIREDLMDLYGFREKLDKDIFIFLMEASGVGAKLALTVLSHSNGKSIIQSIRQGNIAALTNIPGIGRKKAERIILELKDKCEKKFAAIGAKFQNSGTKTNSIPSAGSLESDTFSALLGLGYREFEIRKVMDSITMEENPPQNVENFLKECLKRIHLSNNIFSGNS